MSAGCPAFGDTEPDGGPMQAGESTSILEQWVSHLCPITGCVAGAVFLAMGACRRGRGERYVG